MKTFRLALSLGLFAGLFLAPMMALTRSGGAPAGRTGAPTDQTCNSSGCHNSFTLNSGDGSVALTLPDQYVPGETIDFDVTVSLGTATRFGFEVTALDAANQHVGTFELVGGANTQFADNNTGYITHDNAVSATAEATWTVRWVAPASNMGDVTFYAAGNAANGDGGPSGDRIYTTSQALSAGSGVATETRDVPAAFTLHAAYPNPFAGQTTLRYALHTPASVQLTVMDLQGRVVQRHTLGHQPAGTHTFRLDASALDVGLYLYELRTPTARQTGQLIQIQ